MTAQRAEHCMVCGSLLLYSAEMLDQYCFRCGKMGKAAITCPEGHFICDSCHSESSLTKLPKQIEMASGLAPEDILEDLLKLPGLPMHGPEHHAMAGLVLLTACSRIGVNLPENYVDEMIRRSVQIPGGACGYLGACGGAVSLGIAVSLITLATPLTGLARGMANRATAAALIRCNDDQVRCCKRALRRTISAGRDFFKDELGISFPSPNGSQQCRDIGRNLECVHDQCPYYRQVYRDRHNA